MTAAMRMLGDYNVIKQIGQGALGSVYLAEHRFMKRHYVLKVLPEELATDRSFITRFEEEVKLLSSLDHPHIVKIHNVCFASGAYFLVTDCIVDSMGESTNLAQFLVGKSPRLPEEEVMRLLLPMAEALDYAHQKQVAGQKLAHRGLKLNNVLVGKGKGGLPELYLSDFGLSRIVGVGAFLTRMYKALADALNISITVPVMGQPGAERYPSSSVDSSKLLPLHTSFLQSYSFLAPEQKRQDGRAVDVKADVFAFGVLIYYIISGEYPEGVFEPISTLAPEYKMNWDALLQRLLQSQPSKRPAHLVEALEYFTRQQSASCVAAPVDPAPAERPKTAQAATSPYSVSAALRERQTAQNKERAAQEQDLLPPLPASEAVKEALPKKDFKALKEPAGVKTAPQSSGEWKFVDKGVEPFEPPTLDKPLQPLHTSVMAQMIRETTVTHYEVERNEKRQIEPLLTDMVAIRGGQFWRGSMKGSRDEMPRHQIYLPSFAIDIHPVTNEQFVRFLEACGGEKDHHNNDIIRLRESRLRRSSGKLSIESGYAKHPVVGVTWYGALAYAKWVKRRLPTEAEWEVVALGGLEEAVYPTGEEIEKSQANFFSADTTAVMSYAPNAYGLYDMPGNVYEWCQDWYDYNYYSLSAQEPDSPKGPLQGVYRVLRGGCWKSLKDDLRCSHRHRNNPGTVNRTYGFRLAADIEG